MKTYEDRKSTRLNSSHLGISYAVFCLKKKKKKKIKHTLIKQNTTQTSQSKQLDEDRTKVEKDNRNSTYRTRRQVRSEMHLNYASAIAYRHCFIHACSPRLMSVVLVGLVILRGYLCVSCYSLCYSPLYFVFYLIFLYLALSLLLFFFFFNDTATTEIYTLSLHDALPI